MKLEPKPRLTVEPKTKSRSYGEEAEPKPFWLEPKTRSRSHGEEAEPKPFWLEPKPMLSTKTRG